MGFHGAGIAAAFTLDLLLGEPPERWHPVCWMGRAVDLSERLALGPDGDRGRQRLTGTVTAVVLPVGTWWLTRTALRWLPRRLSGMVELALLAGALAGRSLYDGARSVEDGLARGTDEGRRRVGDMVGRDTEGLGEADVVRAAIESVAENANDGVVAPLFYGLVGGAPLALAYEMVNTMDSMIGYRSRRYHRFDWAAARLDDAAGFIPARLAAAAAAAVSPVADGSARGALTVWRRDAAGHASPNAGVCEAAFAGALGVRLGGENFYAGVGKQGPALGEGLPVPERDDIGRAALLMYAAAALTAAVGLLMRSIATGKGER